MNLITHYILALLWTLFTLIQFGGAEIASSSFFQGVADQDGYKDSLYKREDVSQSKEC